MIALLEAVDLVLETQKGTAKPLAVIVAGHNGSGKSTMWRTVLSDHLKTPLINADRMMLSILPEPPDGVHLVEWAQILRDEDRKWMRVAQQGVQAFTGYAMRAKVHFALETVFSYWEQRPDGSVASKIDIIRDLQEAGYFVLLFFVGLADAKLSYLRVLTRTVEGGHAVPTDKLFERFPRTQQAIKAAASVADATIMMDNSLSQEEAFTVCRVQLGGEALFDIRALDPGPAPEITAWLDLVSPPA